MEQRATSYHSQGLARALQSLRTLSDAGRPLSLAELSAEIDLPKSTLLRLLKVMEEQDFVRREGEPPTYAIGHSVLEIAQAYTPVDVSRVVAPFMKELADELGFTTNLGVIEERSVLHLHVEEPERALRFASSGTLDHAYCTALGKMMLSTMDESEVVNHVPLVEPYESFTPKTLTTFAAVAEDLAAIRDRGYSLDAEERNRGVTCMAVLIPVAASSSVSLSVSAPSGELTERDQLRYLPRLTHAVQELAADPRFVTAIGARETRSP